MKITYFQRAREWQRGQDRLKELPGALAAAQGRVRRPRGQARPRPRTTTCAGPWPILVVERGDKREKVNNDCEQDITNALIKVTRDSKKTVCFAEGEGERDIDDSGERGFSGVKAALAKNQYETKKVVLLREKTVPADCTVLVVAGPEKDLLPEAIDAIKAT